MKTSYFLLRGGILFKKYGTLGIFMILFVEVNYFLKIQPFANWYFPIAWFGYIFIIDALNYKLKGNSLMSNRIWQFIGMLVLSALVWWTFELLNLPIKNWGYNGVFGINALDNVVKKTICFSTVVPAIFETAELIRNIHLFDKIKLKKKHNITKNFLYGMIAAGIISLILPFIFPTYTFPLIWLSFFFLLDPINYMHKQPSIIGHLKDRKLKIPLSLMGAGIVCGFLWEFWNYWAVTKWTYDVPFVNFFKIFEMPILGYFGYFPFALELYVMYFFVRSLFLKKEKLLV